MLKYLDTAIGFQEIPNETSLCINITNCPCGCKGCHSKWLSEDIGDYLGYETLIKLIKNTNEGISCVCFMGGDSEPSWINILAFKIRREFPTLKIAWYSGRQYIPDEIELKNFDYIKIGPYIEELGPLNSRTTNQQFFKIDHVAGKDFVVDITSKFWENGYYFK